MPENLTLRQQFSTVLLKRRLKIGPADRAFTVSDPAAPSSLHRPVLVDAHGHGPRDGHDEGDASSAGHRLSRQRSALRWVSRLPAAMRCCRFMNSAESTSPPLCANVCPPSQYSAFASCPLRTMRVREGPSRSPACF